MTLKFCKHIIHASLCRVTAVILLVSLLSGCAGSSFEVPEEPGSPVEEVKEAYVNLDFRISVNDGAASGSRAFDNEEDVYFEDPNSNYEMVHTLRVVIVREDKTIEHNRMVTVRDNYDGNTITSDDIINDNLQFKVVAGETKWIYLFANESAVNRNKAEGKMFDFTNRLAVGLEFPAEDVSDILIERAENEAFINNGSSTPLAERSYIPMSEFFRVEIPAFEDINADIVVDPSGVAEKYIEEHLFLTRSLIKFSFHISIPDDTERDNLIDFNVKLAGIKINNLSNSCYYLPNNTDYDPGKYDEESVNNPNRVIKSFDMPADPGSSDCTFYFDSPLKLDINGEARSPRLYLPETKTDGEYLVTLMFSDPTQDALYASKPLKLKDIPRNTHVKVNITLGNEGILLLKVDVLPWNREDYYVDYTANIGFNGDDYLKIEGTEGQTGDYLSLSKSDAQLVLNYGKVVKGSFFIASPVDATWDAFLVTTGGEQDAIKFLIPDPYDNTKTITTTHLSGVVGKDKAEFGIVATVPPGPVRNSADLIVIVTLANGTPVVANIVGNWPDCKKDRLTVIENPQ